MNIFNSLMEWLHGTPIWRALRDELEDALAESGTHPDDKSMDMAADIVFLIILLVFICTIGLWLTWGGV